LGESGTGTAGVTTAGQVRQLQVMYRYLQAAVVGRQLSEVVAAVTNLIAATGSRPG
jgi:hypothetical protein